MLLVVLEKGKAVAVVCCANGTDSSHTLTEGKDYTVLDVDKLKAEPPDWLTPKVYTPEQDEDAES
jgi:nitrogenase subunit NifH